MELVYLWVEDYKNIKKQGFNFSPRFRCEYNEDTKELNIVDKEKTGEFYPKNFFAYIGILEQCFQNYLNTFCKNIF